MTNWDKWDINLLFKARVYININCQYEFKSWLNEKFAPELLEHKTAVVECIIEQIKHMENNIKSAKKGDFRIAIHKLEVILIKISFF